MRLWNQILASCAALSVCASGAQAQFINNTTDIPQGSPGNASSSENVDFADVDLDGDWDAAFADGGDSSDDQNRLWINQGGAQAGTEGVFIDRTSTQFPNVADQSRDIEFVDFDNDGDPDIYVSNTAAIVNQSNRWWTNVGGLQSGTIGNYVDDTATRWIGLGTAGSSVRPLDVLPSGGFIDWSCDCDFADLDNDGDLDLFHSSYGGAFGSEVPSRIFLNDGLGFFEEFNPSGHQVTLPQIQNGDPGIWCDGIQQHETSNSDGTFCDVAANPLDIDLGDFDGDFDIDILHGARDQDTRIFANRLNGSSLAPDNGGALGFRDVTGMAFAGGYNATTGNYEQEIGDMDGDGDLDIYGMNWGGVSGGVGDDTLENNGNGIFINATPVDGGGPDDNEADFIDYDNDGDLDVFIANFSGQDRLHRNDPGGPGFGLTNVTSTEIPFIAATALDADVADLDGDGDYDVIASNDFGGANFYYENTSQIPDTHAPYLPNLEQAPNRTAGADPTVIRVHVYDNAPYYITWYNPTTLHYTENGGSEQTVSMRSSGGQVFRGEIPGNACGTIEYWVTSSDEYGNTGQSATQSYIATCGGPLGSIYCNSNTNSSGNTATLSATGSDVVADNVLSFLMTDGPANRFGYYLMSDSQGFIPLFAGSQGNFCLGSPFVRFSAFGQLISATGEFPFSPDLTNLPNMATILPGETWSFQVWFRDVNPTNTSNTSNALEILFQ